MNDLADLKQKVLNGETVSDDEYKTIIANIREGRTSGAGKGRLADKPLPENLDDLFK